MRGSKMTVTVGAAIYFVSIATFGAFFLGLGIGSMKRKKVSRK
jgi:hypothetical protein